MKVHVKLYATLREYAPHNLGIGQSFPVELKEGSISELTAVLGFKIEQAKIIMVNGERVTDLGQVLKDGDLVVIFPPVGGG